jgi:hypothetical protein
VGIIGVVDEEERNKLLETQGREVLLYSIRKLSGTVSYNYGYPGKEKFPFVL